MSLKSKIFGSGPKMKKVDTMTRTQKLLLNQMATQAQQYMPAVTGNMFQLAGAPGGGQFFQQAFANPYLTQRQRMWDSIQQQMGYRHGSAQQKFRSAYEGETSQTMLAQQAQMQMGAMQSLMGLGQGVLGAKAFENVVMPGGGGWLEKASQLATVGMGVGKAVGMMV